MPFRTVDIILLPPDLPPLAGADVTVVVVDVLRATTSIAAALAAGVSEIHVFGSTAVARQAAAAIGREGDVLLCGEEQCLPPPGFQLGNSPGAFTASLHAGRTLFMSTTNGTRAILAARSARRIFTGALVNASAVARAAHDSGGDILLLCAGTNGAVATEDVLGAGAVLHALRSIGPVEFASDRARIAEEHFLACRPNLRNALGQSQGGRNVIAAGLEPDIHFAARVDMLDSVGEVHGDSPPVIRRASRP